MLRKIILIYISFILFSCVEKEKPLPMEEEVLIPLLVDVHIAEAALQNVSKIYKDSMADIYYDQLAEMHKISREELNETVLLMRTSPEKLNEIYTKVVEELGKREAELK